MVHLIFIFKELRNNESRLLSRSQIVILLNSIINKDYGGACTMFSYTNLLWRKTSPAHWDQRVSLAKNVIMNFTNNVGLWMKAFRPQTDFRRSLSVWKVSQVVRHEIGQPIVPPR